SSGVINPESTTDILFTINPALNIGEYNEDIILRTENGFDEKLPITVRVYKTPPDWKVDPTKFEYTMNMIGRVSIEGVLSTDIFDKVAVFVNDSIRGVANLRYLKDFDSYLVFMNVYGNISGEQLDFRIWDASVGQILDYVSPFNIAFIPNGVVGTTLDPVIFEASGLYRQYISLAQGWNWVSFNKLANNQNNLNAFFSSLEPDFSDQIKTKTGFSQFTEGVGWIELSGIDSIDNYQMYQIKISKDDTMIYSGTDIIPEDNPIGLFNGWNNIGYLPDLAMDVNDALRLYVADTSEIIKSQYAFSMYDPRVGWLGTLDVMQPGQGYMLNVKNQGVLTFPNSTVFKGAKIPNYSSPPLGWDNDLSSYEGNMSVVARLDVSQNPEVTVNDQMVLGAFINGECHGFTSPINNSGIGYNPFFLNVSNSENGQWTEFLLFDGMTGNLYSIEETKPFGLNVIYGTTQSPLDLTLKSVKTSSGIFDSESYMRCYPNPFNDQINIEFSSLSGKVSIDVMNATGSLIRRIYDDYPTSGPNRIVWNGRNQTGDIVTSGMYYIRFVSGDTVETVKISKTR
ncbi:MAG: T9SS type A sorting domain-containing protein, partial [Draconibacterium sp.]|nr:T9SS type A sorting domain-containing protein [Draconibacterium sp.]